MGPDWATMEEHHPERWRDGPYDAAATSAAHPGRYQVPMPVSMRREVVVRRRTPLSGMRPPLPGRGAARVRVVLRAARGGVRLRGDRGHDQQGEDRGRAPHHLALRRPAAG